jgi:hypothetical protein
MAGIFAAVFGAGLFAARGTPSWAKDRPHRVSTFSVTWGIGFTVTGAVSLITALGDDSLGQGGKLGGLIVGITFLLMGVPVLLFALWSLISSLGSRDERPMATATSLGSGGGTVSTGAFEGFGTSAPQPVSGFGNVAPAASTSEGNRIAKLQTLADLRKSGALTEQEFEREKARLLGES